MQIKQFEDKNLSHYSYAILSGGYKKCGSQFVDPFKVKWQCKGV